MLRLIGVLDDCGRADAALLQLAARAIDGVSRTIDETRAEIVRYAGSDLVCYRADSPERLAERQRQRAARRDRMTHRIDQAGEDARLRVAVPTTEVQRLSLTESKWRLDLIQANGDQLVLISRLLRLTKMPGAGNPFLHGRYKGVTVFAAVTNMGLAAAQRRHGPAPIWAIRSSCLPIYCCSSR